MPTRFWLPARTYDLPEDNLGLFIELWICQKLEEFELHGCAPRDEPHLRQRLTEMFLERLDD